MFWRLSDQGFDLKRLQLAMKHGSFSEMIWRVIWTNGWSELVEYEGNINSGKDLSILQKRFFRIFSRAEMFREDSLFMEDESLFITRLFCCSVANFRHWTTAILLHRYERFYSTYKLQYLYQSSVHFIVIDLSICIVTLTERYISRYIDLCC